MRFRWSICGKLLCVVLCAFIYCEFFIYYLVISQCSWPSIPSSHQASQLRVMLLADTHLLGPFRGHWFDKLRREWQMYRSFQTAVSIYNPEVVFVLGDLFDEGQWCDNVEFRNYIDRFNSLFYVPKDSKMFVVPGNHDLGFHYVLRLRLLNQFEHAFNVSSVQLLTLKNSFFVLINSMAMEGDYCSLCYDAEKKLMKIAGQLKELKSNNEKSKKFLNYSRPIVLQHFPMYRKSDTDCNERDEAPPELKNVDFKEKWDCLSREASEMIFNELNPRVIFTGHVHHGCHTVHKGDINEYTLPSFSWRNKNNPTFMLASITPDMYLTNKCDLPKESTVIFLYVVSILGSILWFIYQLKKPSKLSKFLQ